MYHLSDNISACGNNPATDRRHTARQAADALVQPPRRYIVCRRTVHIFSHNATCRVGFRRWPPRSVSISETLTKKENEKSNNQCGELSTMVAEASATWLIGDAEPVTGAAGGLCRSDIAKRLPRPVPESANSIGTAHGVPDGTSDAAICRAYCVACSGNRSFTISPPRRRPLALCAALAIGSESTTDWYILSASTPLLHQLINDCPIRVRHWRYSDQSKRGSPARRHRLPMFPETCARKLQSCIRSSTITTPKQWIATDGQRRNRSVWYRSVWSTHETQFASLSPRRHLKSSQPLTRIYQRAIARTSTPDVTDNVTLAVHPNAVSPRKYQADCFVRSAVDMSDRASPAIIQLSLTVVLHREPTGDRS